jgi:hypothetical protein
MDESVEVSGLASSTNAAAGGTAPASSAPVADDDNGITSSAARRAWPEAGWVDPARRRLQQYVHSAPSSVEQSTELSLQSGRVGGGALAAALELELGHLPGGAVSAGATRAAAPSAVRLEVRISWLHIHSVSTEDQEFDAELFVEARCRGGHALVWVGGEKELADSNPASRFQPQFMIQNSKAADSGQQPLQAVVHGVDAVYRQRWTATLQQEFNLHSFPCDTQDLFIMLVERSHDRAVTMVKSPSVPSIFHVNNFVLGNVWQLLGQHEVQLPPAFGAVQMSIKRLELHVQQGRTCPSESTRGYSFPYLKAGVFVKRHSRAYLWNIVRPAVLLVGIAALYYR